MAKLIPRNDAEKQVVGLLGRRKDVRAELVKQKLAAETNLTHNAVAVTVSSAVELANAEEAICNVSLRDCDPPLLKR